MFLQFQINLGLETEVLDNGDSPFEQNGEENRIRHVLVLEHNGKSHPFKQQILLNRIQNLAIGNVLSKHEFKID